MSLESSGQDLSISQMNMVHSAVMIDNDTQKQREKKKKQDEERPADKLELSSASSESAEAAATQPEAAQPSAPLTVGVKIDILAR